MADFATADSQFDGAFCTVDTFRHLITEQQAEQHLLNIASALKPNGIYIMGMHFLSNNKSVNKVTRWTQRRGRLTVKTTMSLVELNRKKRIETLKVVLQPITTEKKPKHTSVYPLRTYTLQQFKKLLHRTAVFQMVKAYDEYYDFERPISLDANSEYAVMVLQKR